MRVRIGYFKYQGRSLYERVEDCLAINVNVSRSQDGT